MKTMAAALALPAILTTLAAGAADFSGWGHTMKIDFPGYARPETLTGFPVLVAFSNTPAFQYGDFLSGSHDDLRFTDAAGTEELPYEVESWNSNGLSHVWVRLPELAPSSTVIRAWWGMAGQAAPAYTTNGTVFDNGYAAVWHLDDAADNTLALDASPNGRHLVNTLSTNAAGVAGSAQGFTTAAWLTGANGLGNLSVTGVTLSTWVQLRGNYNYPMMLTCGAVGAMDFRFSGQAELLQQLFSGYSATVPAANTIPENEWHHVAITLDDPANRVRMFVDGRLAYETTSPTPHAPTGGVVYVGRRSDTFRFGGLLDEMRVSTLARSTNWIWATYLNMASNAAFALPVYGQPFVETGTATAFSDTNAQVSGSLDFRGWTPAPSAAVSVFYGTANGGTDPAAWTFREDLGVQGAGALSATLATLTPNTGFYFAFHASNTMGEAWGQPAFFETTGVPAVDNGAGATAIGYRSASLQGSLLDGVQAAVTVFYGTDPGQLTQQVSGIVLEGPFAFAVAGLDDSTTYYYTSFASNACGTAWSSSTSSFTTLEATVTWTGAGTNTLASNPANWSDEAVPKNDIELVLDGTTNRNLTWDLDIRVGRWRQDSAYSGTVTFLTRYPGQGTFTNLAITGDCLLEGGVWTHPANTGGNTARERLSVSVGGAFTLGPTGRIDVTGRGFATLCGPGAGNQVQRYGTTGKGASHGGMGAHGADILPSSCYDSLTAPALHGSGANGTGGGTVRLAVDGTATLDGVITAAGGEGSYNQHLRGGDAGGSIFLTAGSITGTGTVAASGSSGYWSGGGGRIALVATNAASIGPVVTRALAGPPNNSRGAAGTVFLKAAMDTGRVIVDALGAAPSGSSVTELPPALEDYPQHPAVDWEAVNAALVVTNGGGRIQLTRSVRVGDIPWLGAGSSINLNGLTLFVKADEPALPFPASYGGGTIVTNEGRLVWGDATATARIATTNGPHGVVSQSPGQANDYYPFGTTVTAAATADPGYTFLWWEGNVPAGSNRTANPLAIVVGGTVDLRALFASSDPDTRTWTGDGANSLASNPTNWYPAVAPVSGNHIVFDATSTDPCTWDMDIEPGSWRQDAGYADSYSIITGYRGWVWIRTRFPGQGAFTNLAIQGDVTLEDGAWSHIDNSGVDVAADRLSVSAGGNFTLGSNAVIDVTGRGYAAGRGPGAGNNLQRSYYVGVAASHGGRGAAGYSNAPAACYGSAVEPATLGSGAWQAGGGAVRLAIQGHARIDGTIEAQPGLEDTQRPGGAGGSIWISAFSMAGNGLLDVCGLNGYESGGGGRLAVTLAGSNDFGSVRMRAFGGPGGSNPYFRGAAGTIYRETPSSRTLFIDNNNYTVASTNWHTELPVLAADAGGLFPATLVLTNRGTAGLATNLVMRDLYIRTNSLLVLKGWTLRLKAPYHADWGTPANVVYDEGRILWPATGTLIMVR